MGKELEATSLIIGFRGRRKCRVNKIERPGGKRLLRFRRKTVAKNGSHKGVEPQRLLVGVDQRVPSQVLDDLVELQRIRGALQQVPRNRGVGKESRSSE